MKTWKTKDKSEWPCGEWQNEPDKAQWVDEKTGLDCLIVRGPAGALCGYVGVPQSHKYFDKQYDLVDVEVHGGLTFSDRCHQSESEGEGICHMEELAANKTVWWLGFDCAHAWDVAPKYDFSFSYDSTYRNFNYVKNEVSQLALQLSEH